MQRLGVQRDLCRILSHHAVIQSEAERTVRRTKIALCNGLLVMTGSSSCQNSVISFIGHPALQNLRQIKNPTNKQELVLS
ncbi:hypothetical protein Y1Q_0015634 [Alligator mississippiensis]|uniref:Uncharacterized protein n=1 Tax=Alligator mississippiensis TaxID=8496 RepID=A0A151NNM9_ALLMI|nr:hypothetical protein Y1Q_0015634 [Alligator mississippiensis]